MGDAQRSTRTARTARDQRVRVNLEDPEAVAKRRKKGRQRRATDLFYARLHARNGGEGSAAALARLDDSDSEVNRPLLWAGDERPV